MTRQINPGSSLHPLRVCGESAPQRATIRWAHQMLDLHADRAIVWRKARTLIIADAHFGKAAAFRAHGVPVPEATTIANLARLSKLIEVARPTRLIVLGDLLHSAAGRSDITMNAIAQWRANHCRLQILLIRGNHDHRAGDPPGDWNITCVDEPYIEGPIAFCHDAAATCAARAGARYAMAGHVHPCAILRDVDGSAMRLACFHVSKHLITLPSFGEFTGSHPIRPGVGDRIFAAVGATIIEVRTVPRPSRRRPKRAGKTPR